MASLVVEMVVQPSSLLWPVEGPRSHQLARVLVLRRQPQRQGRRKSALSRCDLGELVSSLVEPSGDVVDLKAVELVFKLAYLLAVGLHLKVMAARSLQDLVDDKL